MSTTLDTFCSTLYHNVVALNERLNMSPHIRRISLEEQSDSPDIRRFTYNGETIIKFQESESLYYADDEEGENAQTGLIISSEADWNTVMGFLYTQEREILAFVVALTVNIIIERLLSSTKLEFIS